MDWIVGLPLALRLLSVFLMGLVAARLINWAIYTWAYFPRKIGPWNPPVGVPQSTKPKPQRPPKANKSSTKRSKDRSPSKRSWLDHVPIFGWFRMRRESVSHGRWYWLRPLLIELIFPFFLAWYYQFHVSGGSLPPGSNRFLVPMASQMHWQFIGFSILFVLLTIATFIDFDEQTIPDFVTIPGTLLGILGAGLFPLWLPLTLRLSESGVTGVMELTSTWPKEWPQRLDSWRGLLLALSILAVWGFALLDRQVILRRGPAKAIQYFFARLFRNRPHWIAVLLVTLGAMAFVTACWMLEISRWNMLLSSLLGLAFAGGVTWAVRLSASYGFGAEALGFGDVTLMAMIGSYLGWQPSLIVFFLAPFVALLFVLVRWGITGKTATPYGPYLCAAVVVLLVFWDALWTNWAAPIFALGSDPILLGLGLCVVLIGGTLWLWQKIKLAVFN